MREHSAAGEREPSRANKYAPRPAICGDAMLVPEMVLVADVDPIQSEMTSTPGPKMSTTGPKLEKEALLSLRSVAPTVQTAGAEEGD